jgi:hypothetical protein
MKIVLIEREMKEKEAALKRCKYLVECLKKSRKPEHKEVLWQISQEQFLLEDQLAHYKIVFSLLQEDQEMYDSVPKRI